MILSVSHKYENNILTLMRKRRCVKKHTFIF